MAKIQLTGNYLLLQKKDIKQSEYEITGGDPTTPIYEIKHGGPDVSLDDGDTVILRPGSYDNINIDGNIYVFAEGDDVAGKVDL